MFPEFVSEWRRRSSAWLFLDMIGFPSYPQPARRSMGVFPLYDLSVALLRALRGCVWLVRSRCGIVYCSFVFRIAILLSVSFLVYPISPSGFLHWFPFLFFACVVFRVVCLRCFLSLFRYVFLVPLLYFLLGCRFAVSLAMRYFERLGISSIRRRLGPVASGGIGRAPIFYFSL